jgi:Protein of unknown function (DUF3303)
MATRSRSIAAFAIAADWRQTGLTYLSSWVDEDLARCYQLMETDDRALLDAWIANWSDIVDFEVSPVMTSAAATERIAPSL